MEIAIIPETEAMRAQPVAADLLMRGMAHDLNNMLAVIASGLSVLQKGESDTRHIAILQGMQRAVFNASTLAKDIVSLTGDQGQVPELISLQSVIDGTDVLVENALGGNITFKTTIPESLWPIRAVRTYLEFALLNLFVNAADAMPGGGTLHLSASNAVRRPGNAPAGRPRSFVRIEVIDSGVGMPPSVLERAFEPFFTTKSASNGTGLGLGQVRRFAEQLGGDILIESTVSRGTRVIIHLPSASPQDR